ncbi:uncharacterized protein LOC135495536 [Lineus longissimus]|uniref:uncharacterized protein LOC135495536 n=1 Tax=Lineus longissimus TaxID=88925 RepID=UPI002B4EA7CA
MEHSVIASCKNIFNSIAADVERKYLLKDEHFFKGELFMALQPKILNENDQWTVKMDYNHPHLKTGKVDLAVLDHRKRSLLLMEVIRQAEGTEPKSLVHKLIRLATLVAWNWKVDAIGTLVIVGDSRQMAEVYIPDNTILYRKRNLVNLDKLHVTKQGTNNFEKYMKDLSNELCLDSPKNDIIPANITVECLRQFSTLKAVKDEEKFAITVWRVRASNQKTFLTEVEKEPVDNSIAMMQQTYKLFNRKWESKPFRLSNKDKVYFYDELCIGKSDEDN